jgi:hypothetical protein
VPVNSGGKPEAPLGSHRTRPEPVPEPPRVPEAERPRAVAAVVLEEVALEPRNPPPPPPEPAAVLPTAPEPPIEVAAAPDVADAELAGLDVEFVADPRGLTAVPVADGAIVGSTTAPPPAG